MRARPPSIAGGDRAPIAALATGLAGLLLFAASPRRDQYPLCAVTIAAFALAPVVLPRVRARLDMPLCPLNWLLLAFSFALVVDPLLLCFGGPYINTLPVLPGAEAVNVSLAVSALAFAGFAAGCELSPRSGALGQRVLRRLRRPVASERRLVLAFALLGVAGLALAFHTPGALLDYFRSAGGHTGTQTLQGGNGPVHAASVVLRSFLAFALLVLWFRMIDRRGERERLVWRSLAVAAAVVLASSTYSYNRASAVAPLVAMVAVYGTRVVRLRIVALALAGVAALGIATAARAYRNSSATVTQLVTSAKVRDEIVSKVDLGREIQIYTSAPQFLGYLLDRTGYGNHPQYGRTLVSSALSPLPRLGRPFRASSGGYVYNRLIYGPDPRRYDQVVPFDGELFLDFAFPGVLLGFAVLGALVTAVQRAFDRAETAFAAFGWQYLALWLGFLVVGSLAVLSQVVLYFMWPLAAYACLRPER